MSDLIKPGEFILIKVFLDEECEPTHPEILFEDFRTSHAAGWTVELVNDTGS